MPRLPDLGAGPLLVAPLLALLAGVAPAAAELSASVLAACRDRLPDSMAAEAVSGELSGRGPAGEWWVSAGQMDGGGGEEAVLVVHEANKRVEAWFVAEGEGDDEPTRERIPLKGLPATTASVSFHRFRSGQSLVHVNAREGGQFLGQWDGHHLLEVWKVGKKGENESRWFNLEDLDGDGTAEVLLYLRRELDLYTDDEAIVESGGADDATLSSGQVDAIGVLQLRDGKWKSDRDLLESLR